MRLLAKALVPLAALAAVAYAGCTTVNPGPNYTTPIYAYDQNYFYCHVQPELLVGKSCGPDRAGYPSCHYSDTVPGMQLVPDAGVNCGGGDQPVADAIISQAAQSNLAAAETEMDPNYLNAELYLRPTDLQGTHPLQVFSTSDPVVQVISTWANSQQ